MQNITKKLFAGIATIALAGSVVTPAFAADSISVKDASANNSNVALVNGDYVALGLNNETGDAFHADATKSFANLTKNVESRFDNAAKEAQFKQGQADGTIYVDYDVKSASDIALYGRTELKANIMADGDITIGGENFNANDDSIIYSANGDIYVTANNSDAKGFYYAPNGTVHFLGQYNNLNHTVVIAKDVQFKDSISNVNPADDWSNFVNYAISR